VVAEQQSELLALLKEEHPEHFQSIAVHGENPSGSLLLFLAKRGGTYLFRKDSGDVEAIRHAKLILPSGITRITYSDMERSFILWAGDRYELSIVVGK
jgi:hypothetical protein